MTYDLCHGGHMVAEYPLLHTPNPSKSPPLSPPITPPIGGRDGSYQWLVEVTSRAWVFAAIRRQSVGQWEVDSVGRASVFVAECVQDNSLATTKYTPPHGSCCWNLMFFLFPSYLHGVSPLI